MKLFRIILTIVLAGDLISITAGQTLAVSNKTIQPIVTVTIDANQLGNFYQNFLNAKQPQRINRLQLLAGHLIDARIKSVQKILDRLNSAKDKISEADYQTISQILNQNLTDLNNLKNQINAEKDLTGLTKDTRSIFNQFRIFAIVSPQTNGLIIVAKANVALLDINESYQQVNAKVTALPADQTNKADLQSKMTTIGQALDQTKTSLSQLQQSFLALKPGDWPNNKTQLKTIKDNLKQTVDTLQKNWQDLKTIQQQLG